MARMTKLKIIIHNANGIYSDRLCLQELLHRLDVDIALISETKVPPWFQWRIPGYKIYNTLGPNPTFGGTAVVVKSTIQHAEISMPTLNSLQATAIKIELGGLETVVGALYHSPSKPFVEEDYDKLIRLSVSKRFILGGDLNCKHTDWNSRVVTRKGKLLAKHADKHSYAISAPDKPTYKFESVKLHTRCA